MKSYFSKKKKDFKHPFFSWLVIFILFCIIVFLLKSVFIVFQGERKSNINRNQSELIFNELKENENIILSEIEYLKTEKGIETELRDKFRIVKEGEQMAVIINTEKEKSLFVNKEQDIWKKIKSFLNF